MIVVRSASASSRMASRPNAAGAKEDRQQMDSRCNSTCTNRIHDSNLHAPNLVPCGPETLPSNKKPVCLGCSVRCSLRRRFFRRLPMQSSSAIWADSA